ncbi:unnamed protein product [Staurois parvus]|uniref:Uncharacterized protein n=1 Tax=Staurois parvus TaxID=386267 RepID=A0ABN9D4R2_9NEOB|nr:unnamed protein product [Staurois parvus]
MAEQRHPEQCAYIEEHPPPVKHSYHTVNPLIAPHVKPFLPSAISTVSVLFVALITVLVSLGMSVTPRQFPPSFRMPTAVPL